MRLILVELEPMELVQVLGSDLDHHVKMADSIDGAHDDDEVGIRILSAARIALRSGPHSGGGFCVSERGRAFQLLVENEEPSLKSEEREAVGGCFPHEHACACSAAMSRHLEDIAGPGGRGFRILAAMHPELKARELQVGRSESFESHVPAPYFLPAIIGASARTLTPSEEQIARAARFASCAAVTTSSPPSTSPPA